MGDRIKYMEIVYDPDLARVVKVTVRTDKN